MAWKTSDNFKTGTANDEIHDMVDELQKEGGLCPNCENRFMGKVKVISTFTANDMIFYYALCDKCFKKVQKGKEKDREKIRLTVEKNLNYNTGLYIAIVKHIDDVSEQENDRLISVTPDNHAEWQQDDKEFFEKNPRLKFRARYIYDGEIESTQKVKPHLKGDEVKKGINTAIVHKVTNEQFIRSYVTDLSNYPHEDESFIAALFIVLLKDIDPSKIMEIYKDIKERKTMFKSMEDLQTFY